MEKICTRLSELGEDLPEFIVLGGDTNTVFSSMDKIGGCSNLKVNAIQSFENLKTRFDLIDTYRFKNPFLKEFTWEVLNPSH